jgi:glycosyltransferase involved in cell wall biosynthesis
MSSPRVSIGLPVYNGAKYLSEAIESVRAQTFADFELVISDNASADETEEICRDFAARDERVRYFRAEENGGAAWNFNRTFELAAGEYFKWMAHDDVVGPRYIERTLAVMEQQPELVLCHAQTGIIDETGLVIIDPTENPERAFRLQGITAEMEAKRLESQRAGSPARRYRGTLIHSIRNYEIFGVIRRDVMRGTLRHGAYRGGEKAFLAELSVLGPFEEVPEVLSFNRWHTDRFSANTSAQSQNLHVNPRAARGFRWPRQLRATAGYLQAAQRHKLSVGERAGCLLGLTRFLLQGGKFKAAIAEYLGGVGQLAELPDDWERPAEARHWTAEGPCPASSGQTAAVSDPLTHPARALAATGGGPARA